MTTQEAHELDFEDDYPEQSPLYAPRTLYDISADLREVERALADEEADDETVAVVVAGYLELCAPILGAKIDGYHALYREIDARAKSRRVESKRLAKQAANDERAAEALKSRLAQFMIDHKLTEVKGNITVASLCGNGGLFPMEIQTGVHPADFPEKYQEIVVELDEKKLRADCELRLELHLLTEKRVTGAKMKPAEVERLAHLEELVPTLPAVPAVCKPRGKHVRFS